MKSFAVQARRTLATRARRARSGSAGSLPEGRRQAGLPAGTLQGLNDWKRTG